MVDCVDLSRIQETSDGDIEFEQELIEMYLEDARDHLESLEKHISGNDLTSVKQLAHTIKGSSANIGATAMQNVAFEIEKAAAKEDSAAMQTLVGEIKTTFQETETFYNDYLSGLQ